MDDNTASITVSIQMDDGFEPGPRTAAAVAELAEALDDEHGSGDEVSGFSAGPPLRNYSFGFASNAGGSPNVLMDTNPPTGDFAPGSGRGFSSGAGGSPNV